MTRGIIIKNFREAYSLMLAVESFKEWLSEDNEKAPNLSIQVSKDDNSVAIVYEHAEGDYNDTMNNVKADNLFNKLLVDFYRLSVESVGGYIKHISENSTQDEINDFVVHMKKFHNESGYGKYVFAGLESIIGGEYNALPEFANSQFEEDYSFNDLSNTDKSISLESAIPSDDEFVEKKGNFDTVDIMGVDLNGRVPALEETPANEPEVNEDDFVDDNTPTVPLLTDDDLPVATSNVVQEEPETVVNDNIEETSTAQTIAEVASHPLIRALDSLIEKLNVTPVEFVDKLEKMFLVVDALTAKATTGVDTAPIEPAEPVVGERPFDDVNNVIVPEATPISDEPEVVHTINIDNMPEDNPYNEYNDEPVVEDIDLEASGESVFATKPEPSIDFTSEDTIINSVVAMTNNDEEFFAKLVENKTNVPRSLLIQACSINIYDREKKGFSNSYDARVKANRMMSI